MPLARAIVDFWQSAMPLVAVRIEWNFVRTRVLNLNANEIEEKVTFPYLFSIIRKWLWPVIKKISALQF